MRQDKHAWWMYRTQRLRSGYETSGGVCTHGSPAFHQTRRAPKRTRHFPGIEAGHQPRLCWLTGAGTGHALARRGEARCLRVLASQRPHAAAPTYLSYITGQYAPQHNAFSSRSKAITQHRAQQGTVRTQPVGAGRPSSPVHDMVWRNEAIKQRRARQGVVRTQLVSAERPRQPRSAYGIIVIVIGAPPVSFCFEPVLWRGLS